MVPLTSKSLPETILASIGNKPQFYKSLHPANTVKHLRVSQKVVTRDRSSLRSFWKGVSYKRKQFAPQVIFSFLLTPTDNHDISGFNRVTFPVCVPISLNKKQTVFTNLFYHFMYVNPFESKKGCHSVKTSLQSLSHCSLALKDKNLNFDYLLRSKTSFKCYYKENRAYKLTQMVKILCL